MNWPEDKVGKAMRWMERSVVLAAKRQGKSWAEKVQDYLVKTKPLTEE